MGGPRELTMRPEREGKPSKTRREAEGGVLSDTLWAARKRELAKKEVKRTGEQRLPRIKTKFYGTKRTYTGKEEELGRIKSDR